MLGSIPDGKASASISVGPRSTDSTSLRNTEQVTAGYRGYRGVADQNSLSSAWSCSDAGQSCTRKDTAAMHFLSSANQCAIICSLFCLQMTPQRTALSLAPKEHIERSLPRSPLNSNFAWKQASSSQTPHLSQRKRTHSSTLTTYLQKQCVVAVVCRRLWIPTHHRHTRRAWFILTSGPSNDVYPATACNCSNVDCW